MTFGKDMKIGEGQKYDTTQVSKEGLSKEKLAKIEKKNRKLINIYNKDGNKDLSGLELSLAMDGFQVADMNKDGKLSKEELKIFAAAMNETYELEGDDAVSFRDLKRFLKDVTKATKKHKKSPTSEVLFDGKIESIAKKNEWQPVQEYYRTFMDKDGRVFVANQEENRIMRARFDEKNDEYVEMTNQEVYIQDSNIYADKHGYEQVTDSPLFTKQGEHPDKKYLFNVETQEMVRGRQNEDGTFEGLSADEIKTQDEQIAAKQAAQAQKDAEEQRQKDLATPKDYTVQNGETLTGLLKKSLKAQGIENPTKEQIAEAKAEFIKNNPKGVHGPKGKEILWAGDVVKIAGNLEDKNNAEQVKNDYRAFVSRQKAAEKAREAAEEEKRLKGAPPYAPVPKTPDIPSWDMDWQNKPYPGLDLFNPLEDPNKDVKVPLAPSRPATPASPAVGAANDKYTGVKDGKYYENGVVKTIATKQLVKYDEETSKTGRKYPDDYYRNYNTYHYGNGSLTPLYRDPTYDSNVQIKIGNQTFELAKGPTSGYAHWDFKDFLKGFVDSETGAIRANKYAGNTYYLKSGDTSYPVNIDKQTKALMVEVNGKKIDMNDLMTGKVKI